MIFSTSYRSGVGPSPGVPDASRTHHSSRPKSDGGSRWTVDDLLAGLQAVRPAGEGKWTAKCPAHDDRRPSLSVAVGADGKVLVHCFAGCRYADVIAAIRPGSRCLPTAAWGSPANVSRYSR